MNHFDTQAVTVLFSVVSIAVILKLMDAWASYRVAALRQDLFEIDPSEENEID